MSKICNKCHQLKSLSDFYINHSCITTIAYLSRCKVCMNIATKSRRKICPTENLIEKKCIICGKIKPICEYYISTRHKDGYYKCCKLCQKEKMNNWGKNPRFKRTKEYMKKYNKKRFSIPKEKIKHTMRKSISLYTKKNKGTIQYLLADISFFKLWIEYNFDEKMNWDNHGTYWHFDHIRPCDSFDLIKEDQILECFNWSNLRPLYKMDNIYKGNTIDNDLINKFKNKKEIFLEKYKNKYVIKNDIYCLNNQ